MTPPKGRRSLLPLIAIPLGMGTTYLGIAYPRFWDNSVMIWEHLFLLAYWIITGFLLMMAIRELLVALGAHFLTLPCILVPVFTNFILYCLYAFSVVGNLTWGSGINYKRFVRFLPYVLDLADNFNIPRAFVFLILILPCILLFIVFRRRERELLYAYWALKQSFREMSPWQRRLRLSALGIVWVLANVLIWGAQTDLNITGNFSHDPVVTFFKVRPTVFPMTKERVFWAQRDQAFRKAGIWKNTARVRNVFLFVVDALRADHLPLYGYPRPLTPHFGSYLSHTEHRSIQWGLSNGLESGSGLMVLSTSKEPLVVSHLNYTLFDYFHDQGFKVSLILSGDHKMWLSRNALGQGLDLVHDGSDFPGPRGPFDDQLVLNELGNLEHDDGGRHFFYIHLMSVHQTAILLDEYAVYRPYHNFIDPKFKPGYRKNAEDIQEIVNMYDDRILQMDDFMGKILTLLRTKGYLDDFVGVFTADHGQLLGEKGVTGHGYYPLAGGLHIPLVFFSSQKLPAFDQVHVATQMDIAPTLTDLAGLTPPSIWEGQSLLRKRKDPWSYHLSPTTRPGVGGAVIYGTATKLLKYSRPLDPDKKGLEELYDLDADPEEKHDLIGSFDPKWLGDFREKANQHLGEF